MSADQGQPLPRRRSQQHQVVTAGAATPMNSARSSPTHSTTCPNPNG